MPNPRSARSFSFVQTVKKFTVSAFVVSTFVAYAIHDRLNGSDSAIVSDPPSSPETDQAAVVPSPTDISPSSTSVAIASVPSSTPVPASPTRIRPSPTVAVKSGYRDGQYTGNLADAFFGEVQVK